MAFGPSPISLPGPTVPAFELFGSELLTWVLVGLAAYWFGLIALRQRNLLPSYVGTQGPIVTLHTKRGREFLDWLSGPKRFWRAWANVGVGIAIVVMGGMFLFLLVAAYSILQAPDPGAASGVHEPRNVLVIPGVNDFLPLSAAPAIVAGLLVGLVVHEGGHGLLCRVEDIEIKSMGVAMLAVIPIGAFVEPDEQSSRAASRGGQTRMFAAGVTNNLAITVVAFALLFGPVAGAITVAPGAAVGGVAPDSPAGDAGIEPNDRITAVDGESVDDSDHLEALLEAADGEVVEIELNGEETVSVEPSLLVAGAAEASPVDLAVGDSVVAVDGDPVATERAFLEAVGDDERVTLTVDPAEGDREERTVTVGALAEVVEDGPLADAGGEPGEQLVLTAFDGERVHATEDLLDLIDDYEPGDEVVVAGYDGDDRVEFDVTLGENPQTGDTFLGIGPYQGVSGLTLSELGVQFYPAEEYLGALGGEGESSFGIADTFLGKIGIALFLPFIGVLGVLPFNFAGFVGGVENFYEIQGALGAVGDPVVFALANVLFWTAWINVQLAFFNCIPAFPLDGGHILRTSTEAVLSRLPIDATRGMVRTVTTTVGLTMLFSFLLMVFGPTLLSG